MQRLLKSVFGFNTTRDINRETPAHYTLPAASTEPVFMVDARYLSFSIDISVLAGGFWWEGSRGTRRGLGTLRVPPLELHRKKLDRLVKALGPSYLRVGGSEADKIHYFECDEAAADALVLKRETWDSLHDFIQRNNLKFAFTFKYGLFNRKLHGEWVGTEIQKLLFYSLAKNYVIDVCELGNELNAYWAFHGIASQPRAKNLAHDYTTFAQLIRRYYPNIRICGPGSAFWPRLGETIKPFSNITKKFLESLTTQLDIIDWHYYPFQSERSPIRTRAATLKNALSVSNFDAFTRFSRQLEHMRNLHQPEAELWTGETGSAQCGGQPKISDRYASSFWWADQLGQGALRQQKVMVRQSLIGGDYGMIDRLTLKPRPDYWISWLWVQMMGEETYLLPSPTPELRVYCHKHTSGSGYCILVVNPGEQNFSLDISQWGTFLANYTVTASKNTAKKIHINGVKPEFKKGKVSLEDFPQNNVSPTVPPYSINFWHLNN